MKNATAVVSEVINACGLCAGAVNITNNGLACAKPEPIDCVLLRLITHCREAERAAQEVKGVYQVPEKLTRDWIEKHAAVTDPGVLQEVGIRVKTETKAKGN